MTSVNTTLLPQQDKEVELVEAYRQLIALYGFTTAPERDTYSLAQPSPFRFIPTEVSSGTVTLTQGE